MKHPEHPSTEEPKNETPGIPELSVIDDIELTEDDQYISTSSSEGTSSDFRTHTEDTKTPPEISKQTFQEFFHNFHMQSSLRLVLGMSVLAMFLVVFFGFVHGVGVAIILLRTVISGIIFAVLGFCFALLIEAFVPELWELQVFHRANRSENRADSQVNFLVDEQIDPLLDSGDIDTHDTDGLEANVQTHIDLDIPHKKSSIHSKYAIPEDPGLLAQGIQTVMRKK